MGAIQMRIGFATRNPTSFHVTPEPSMDRL
jgi:hypothetical protein